MPLVKRAQPDAVLACPVDEAPMTKQVVEGATIDRCGTCKGMWFDDHELRRVAQDREIESLATRVGVLRVVSELRCPRCGGECTEGQIAEVVVDTCTSCHGVWLDRGELEEAKRQVHVNRLARTHGAGFRDFLSRV